MPRHKKAGNQIELTGGSRTAPSPQLSDEDWVCLSNLIERNLTQEARSWINKGMDEYVRIQEWEPKAPLYKDVKKALDAVERALVRLIKLLDQKGAASEYAAERISLGIAQSYSTLNSPRNLALQSQWIEARRRDETPSQPETRRLGLDFAAHQPEISGIRDLAELKRLLTRQALPAVRAQKSTLEQGYGKPGAPPDAALDSLIHYLCDAFESLGCRPAQSTGSGKYRDSGPFMVLVHAVLEMVDPVRHHAEEDDLGGVVRRILKARRGMAENPSENC